MTRPSTVSTCRASGVVREGLDESAGYFRPLVARYEALAVDGLGDAEAYRMITREALTMLHAAGQREQQLRRQLAALRDELRRYTAAQVGREAA